MPHSDPKTLVSTQWLADHFKDPDLRVLDGSWHLPPTDRDALAEFEANHIPNARFFDIDEIADSRSPLPHMVPTVEKFMSRVRAMGVGDGHKIVVYDVYGIRSAARVWWLFRLMGHENVAVLDGGLPKWVAEGHPTDSTPPVIRDRHMTVNRQNQLVKDVTEVAAASKLCTSQILDARPRGRFLGSTPEPRAGLRSGHMPNAKSLPHSDILNADGTMKDLAGLRSAYQQAGIDLEKPVITTCGSGVTAAVLSLGLERLGHKEHALYDGSWAEWGIESNLKVVTGE
ncbi:thiosulfate sulfurtransferase, putative [Rhodobacterales bacterium HTCC2150]|nr:thiosulfate sulfurtransferase, putative [Rhodobacterales bacterium HTCC2150] [Rhodobacteraceae bacterium HTCC2150]